MLKFLPYLHESRMDFWNAPTIYSNDRRFVIIPFILQPCIGDVLFIASSTMQRWRGVWNILRTVENFLRSLSDNLFILRENIRVYSTKKWISFLFFVQTRFSRGLFCSFLSAWLFHPFQYFFRIPVCLSTFLLSRSSRVFARLHAFHLVPSSFPSLVSFLFLPPLSLPSLNSNERTSFVQIEYSTKSYAIGLFVSSRGRRWNDALPKWTEREIYADSLVTSVCNLHATHGPLMASDGCRAWNFH